MLTNLLAVYLVILLSCPSVALAGEIDRTPSAAKQTDVQIPKTTTAGALQDGSYTQDASAGGEKASSGGNSGSGASGQADATRVLTARLKGSLCVSCLYQLERKIQELGGVKSARVIRPPKKAASEESDRAFAQVQIVYVSSKLNPKKIRQFIHHNDFGIKDENDIAYTADFKPLVDPFESERASKVINVQYK